MTLIERILNENIFIDLGKEEVYGSDKIENEEYTTLTIYLIDTILLNNLADRIRIGLGFKPAYTIDGYRFEDCDVATWYDFLYTIYKNTNKYYTSTLTFVPVNGDTEDEGKEYQIELSDEEQKAIYECVNTKWLEYMGQDLQEALSMVKE